MKPPADGWNRDERAVLDMLGDELEAVRARHHDDPPAALLRAAQADALPEELNTEKVRAASQSEWGRALIDGLDTVERPLSGDDEQRLLARVRKAIRSGDRSGVPWNWVRWVTITAAAAIAIVVVVKRTGNSPAALPASTEPVPTVAQSEPPRFVLALEKPEVKLSAAVLTFRGAGDDDFVGQLTKALDAFRANDYAGADRQLTVLEKRHPIFDVYYYQGLSRLLAGDAAGAVVPLQKAASLADRLFAPDVQWFTAVAEERSGQLTRARDRLADLCRTSNPYSQRACEAQKQLESSLKPPS